MSSGLIGLVDLLVAMNLVLILRHIPKQYAGHAVIPAVLAVVSAGNGMIHLVCSTSSGVAVAVLQVSALIWLSWANIMLPAIAYYAKRDSWTENGRETVVLIVLLIPVAVFALLCPVGGFDF